MTSNTDNIDRLLADLGYGPNLAPSNRGRPKPYMPSPAEQAHARQANGPRPRAAQQAKHDPATAGLTAEERAIDAALNRPDQAKEGDDLADLPPADQELMRKWRDSSPAILEEDQATEQASSSRGLSAADEQLYREAWGGR